MTAGVLALSFLAGCGSSPKPSFDTAPVHIVATTTTAPRTTTTRASRSARPTIQLQSVQAAAFGHGACGGTLPPCWVLRRESKGNIRAVNPRGCGGRGCYGKWQFDPKTWLGCWGRSCVGLTYKGYARADEAPEDVQDDRAREIWNGGRGCDQWDACA